jgi:hypothetical protein
MSRVVVFDSEMVHALGTVRSKKHRQAVALTLADNELRGRKTTLVVPSTVRVEAGWDRIAPRWAAINRLGVRDHHLDLHSTDVAARLRAEHGVSPADAHIGAVVDVQSPDDDVVVVTSDPDDIAKVTQQSGARVVRI